jgi:hypothetical protein
MLVRMTFLGIFAARIFPLALFEPVPFEFEEECRAESERQLTAGELRQSIERQLGNKQARGSIDAAEELRSALAEIRRSLA